MNIEIQHIQDILLMIFFFLWVLIVVLVLMLPRFTKKARAAASFVGIAAGILSTLCIAISGLTTLFLAPRAYLAGFGALGFSIAVIWLIWLPLWQQTQKDYASLK